uniref:Uncharacterized protein n=1 Tax=Meloidogyne enterolobii TaxID=390850 RepID=A0A6V7WGU4_MELEN|nr:unnamed protein product [Meloidogyne enterolobii]
MLVFLNGLKNKNILLELPSLSQWVALLLFFEALEIKNTFNVFSNVFYPTNLQFLDFGGKPLDVTKYRVPGQNNENKCLRKSIR